MTKRLALAMLCTVWAILIASGLTAYWTARAVLVANLDDALVARAMLPSQSEGFAIKRDGYTIDSTVKGGRSTLPKPELLSARFVTSDDGARVRSAMVRVFHHENDGSIGAENVIQRESAESLDRLLNRLIVALVIAGCAGGVIAAFVARSVAIITLRPLRSTAQTIGEIDESNLSRRIDASKLAPELAPVALKLNEMLARLETSFENRKRFLADASHELRTPVAALVTTLEVSLRRIRDAEACRETMQTCLADARLMRKLVDSLMLQARSEIAQFKEESLPTDVNALLAECVAILQALADEKGVTLSQSIEEPIQLQVAPGRLKQAVMGLLENAIDHNRPGGTVELVGVAGNSQVVIEIRDTGPGIAPEHLPRLFEPFYRASQSRAVAGHMGLGLYLVKTHLDAIFATVSVSSEIGKGSVFQILLPARNVLQKHMEPAIAG